MPVTDIRNLPVCKYYALGNCTRGVTCRYYHPLVSSGESVTAMPLSRSPCPHYLRGQCRYGAQCRQEHSNPYGTPPQPESAADYSTLKPSWRKDVMKRPIDPSAAQVIVPTRPITFGPCKFFQQGTCSKGDHCPFPHISPDFSPQHAPSAGVNEPGSAQQGANPGEPCRFFIAGKCRNGESCPFLHTTTEHSLSLSPPPLSSNSVAFDEKYRAIPSVKDHVNLDVAEEYCASGMGVDATSPEDTAERFLFSCKVIFGPGASVQEITTAFESRYIIVSNLPAAVTEEELIELTEPLGELARISIERPTRLVLPTARIEFGHPDEARGAVHELHNKKWHSKELAARLDLRAVDSGAGTLLSRKVKVSWYAPSTIAWAHYGTISLARAQASQLDGETFDGRKLSVSFQSPKSRFSRGHTRLNSPSQTYSIEIKGLPLGFNQVRLKQVCRAQSVIIGGPSYDRQDGINTVRRRLLEFGPLDSYEVPSADRLKPKITAFAQFSSTDGAAAAAKELHNKPQPFLRGSHVWVEHIYSIKYNILAARFTALKADLDRLRDAHDGKCTMRYYDRDEAGRPVENVCIRIYGADPKKLGLAKAELELLIRGELLVSEGKDVWDEYFNTSEGQTFLKALNDGSPFFVSCDARTRTLRIFGNDHDRARAKGAVVGKLQETVARRHVIHLEKDVLGSLLRGGLKAIHDDMGSDAVIMDVVSRTLTVRGDEDDVKKIRRAVGALELSSHASLASLPTAVDEALCPVCFCDVTEPVTLSCQHAYCKACLQHLLRSAAGPNFSVLKCVAETQGADPDKTAPCKAQIPYAIIRELLLPAEETRLLEASYLSHIHALPKEFHYCPTPDCQVVYRPGERGTVLQCPACLSRICAACDVEFHEGLSCAEHHANLDGGNEAFRKWRKEHGVKPCPKCSTDLEKNGGCNHIHCIRCGVHICWTCMKTFAQEDARGGVYQHMREAHGGMY